MRIQSQDDRKQGVRELLDDACHAASSLRQELSEIDGGDGVTTTGVSSQAFEALPAPGEAFFFLVEYLDGRYSGYGTATGVGDVVVTSGDVCH